jgi:prepilin-type N-terminal cleavage/methylation domain-containing protein
MSARNHCLSQRGFSLAELMTALAVFAIIFVAALLLYDRSNRVFSSGTQSAEMQQTTRVAFDKVLQDVRMAGFDYKRGGVPVSSFTTRKTSSPYVVGQMVLPDVANGHVYKCTTGGTSAATPITWSTGAGSPTTDGSVIWTEAGAITAAFDQPDEQIEYAWHSAVTIRGNYNYDTPDDATLEYYEHGREGALETPQFPVVTTGNDEIVTYVLHSDKPGAANSDSVVYYADVNNGGAPSRTAYPGGHAERAITISSVDLSNANPPYTLLRVTLDSAGALVRTPLADNIRSLNLEYYQDPQGQVPLKDTDGDPIVDVGGNGAFDPGTPATANHVDRLTRKNIRAVKITLVGMNSAEDRAYNDPADTIAPHYRKMTLSTTIVPRNLGIISQIQSPLQPPPAPISVAVCTGYCGIPYVTWLPGDPSTYTTGSTGAESFSVAYDDDVNGTFSNVLPAGTLTSFAVDMTQLGTDIATKTYYFKVGATNAAGTKFSDPIGPVSIKNATKPAAPGSVTAVGSGGVATPKVTISWRTPASNASGSPSCTSGTTTVTTVASEVRGYRIFRSGSSGFTPIALVPASGGNMISDVGGAGQNADGAGGWSFDDTTVSACAPFYYKVQAVEWCNAADNYNVSNDKNDAVSGYSSEVTGQVTANKASTPAALTVNVTTACNFGTNQCTPVSISWTKVTTDTSLGTINVPDYDVFRRTRHGATTGSYAKVGTVPAPVGSTVTFTESSPLQDHETTTPFDQDYYDYYVVANFACGNSDPTLTVTVPNNCDTGVTISTTNGTGSGTAASPWVAPANGTLNVKLNQGASPYTAITAGTVLLDGTTTTTLSSPWVYGFADRGDGQTHTLTFRAQTTSSACMQTLATVYIQSSPVGCHLQNVTADPTMLVLTTSPPSHVDGAYELSLTLKNLSQDVVTVKTIVITDAVPKKGHWNSVALPSGASLTTATPLNLPANGGSSGSVTFTKTFDLTTLGTAEKQIGAASSKVYRLVYVVDNGGNAVATTNITSVLVTMTTAAGGTTTFTCTVK